MPTMVMPVYIKELEPDRVYEGSLRFGEAEARFRLSFTDNWHVLHKVIAERILSGENPQSLQGLIEKESSIEIFSASGRPIPVNQVKDVLFRPIYEAHNLLEVGKIIGRGTEGNFVLDLEYTD